MMPHLLLMVLAVMILCPIILVDSFDNYTTLITSFLSPITVIMEAIAFHTSIFQNNSVLIICSFVIVISSQNNCGRGSNAKGRTQQLNIFPLWNWPYLHSQFRCSTRQNIKGKMARCCCCVCWDTIRHNNYPQFAHCTQRNILKFAWFGPFVASI